MASEETKQRQQEFHELTGALAAINTLQEKLELRLNEARDDSVCETLDNVIALVCAYGMEYQRRKMELHAALASETTA